MRKVIFTVLACLMVVTPLVAQGTKEDSSAANELVVYASVDEANAVKILDAFTADTQIKTSFVQLSSGPALTRIQAESGKPQADVWLGAPSDNHVIAKKDGLTVPYKGPNFEALGSEFKDAEGYWRGFYMNPLCFGINTVALAKAGATIPRSWADLLKPEYKGLIQMPTPQASGTAVTMVYSLIEMMGEDQAFAYMAKLNKNVQTYTSSGTGPSKGVNVGDCAIGIQFSPAFFQMKANGQPIEIVFPSEGFGFEFPAASILKGAKNYEAAKIFMEWLVSKKGQDVLKSTGTYFYPVIDDAEIDPVMPAFSTLHVVGVDLSYYSSRKQQLVERWVSEVLSAK
ncbi:ABC-type Fe3+ transport system, periplasmic component [Sphaerochaeta pleomorpha str. Grapes]|uniref:ABC-type Fe3+ transport system, periplasmic component n=1 Tax=Sphaerochaeta pleomorpha (strain ATCC BAA-1885 / DSM 22778 / Grapes) TaxID=158190 RepID=G8QTN8_SPHPG|nr:ABC transporter substrate-binding protein [Sphaerochaeta pleomorpha]AEV28003.1 ABC-type Fe3+ transport system, periplasmic component [Sphaerochaeta pleomorpha str. Grapes]